MKRGKTNHNYFHYIIIALLIIIIFLQSYSGLQMSPKRPLSVKDCEMELNQCQKDYDILNYELFACQAVELEPPSEETLPIGTFFTTRDTYPGNLGGFDGAKEKCMASAGSAGLSGEWIALIGDVSSHYTLDQLLEGYGFGDSLPGYSYSFNRIDGQPLADNLSDLLSGDSLDSQMNIDQYGSIISNSSDYAWTAFKSCTYCIYLGHECSNDGECVGGSFIPSCENVLEDGSASWVTSEYGYGKVGSIHSEDERWYYDGAIQGEGTGWRYCHDNHHLYCLKVFPG